MKKKYQFLFVLLILFLFSSCTTPPPENYKVNDELKKRFLQYYDSFDELRDDLWEMKITGYSQNHLDNFSKGDAAIENGKIVTQTGLNGFSNAYLRSKYLIRGNFDIQIDMEINIQVSNTSDDQVGVFFIEFTNSSEEELLTDGFFIGVVKKGHQHHNAFMTAFKSAQYSDLSKKETKRTMGKYKKIGNKFNGGLRLVRKNDIITAYVKWDSNDDSWSYFNEMTYSLRNIYCGFGTTNFVSQRALINPRSKIVGRFDNFKINYADEILETEI